MGEVVVCDLDGTLCDNTHRVHHAENKEWDLFHAGIPHDDIYEDIYNLLAVLDFDYVVIFCTGRPNIYRTITNKWLRKHLSPAILRNAPYSLMMRKKGDHRSDVEVKRDMMNEIGKHNIFLVLEDRDRIVDMWRSEGVTCLQTRRGDY